MDPQTANIITMVLQTLTIIPIFLSLGNLFTEKTSLGWRLIIAVGVSASFFAIIRRISVAYGIADDLTSLPIWRIVISAGALLEWSLIASLSASLRQRRSTRELLTMADQLLEAVDRVRQAQASPRV